MLLEFSKVHPRLSCQMLGILTALIVPLAWSQCQTSQLAELLASDGIGGDRFGVSVAIDGGTALVGAEMAHVLGQANAGAAYVFVNSGGVWIEQAKFTASDPTAVDYLGCGVALDGDTALIGVERDDDSGTDSGAVYVFVRCDGVWSQQARLTASTPEPYARFGGAVAIRGDIAVIGAEQDGARGAAYVFVRSAGAWTQSARIEPASGSQYQQFGISVALDGDTAIIGAFSDNHSGLRRPGSAYIFQGVDGVWTQQAKLIASDPGEGDSFGAGVALQGDTAVIGAPGNDGAGTDAGAAYVFVRSGDVWTEQAKLVPSDLLPGDAFGRSVAVHADEVLAGAALSGSPNRGAAYVFTRSGATWVETARLADPDPQPADFFFGCSVALDGDTAILGAMDDSTGAGSVFLFDVHPNCACCLPDGSCVADLSEAQCMAQDGTALPVVSCDSEPCSVVCLPGDANCDGAVNAFDIDPFVLALTDETAWRAAFACDYLCVNDTNDDGAVNAFDIDPFVAYLVSAALAR